MRTTCLFLSICLGMTQWAAYGQSPAAFEVGSIKPRVDDTGIQYGRQSPPDRFTWQDVTLNVLIRYAYDLFEFQVATGRPGSTPGVGRLQSSRGPVQVLVVDSVSEPATR